MSQYRVGTVTVTNASAEVTGVDTLWESVGIEEGSIFMLQGLTTPYYIGSVDSNTVLQLTAPYAGDTDSGAEYVIVRDYFSSYDIPMINKGDVNWPALFNEAMRIITSQLAEIDTSPESTHNRGSCLLAQGSLYDEMTNVVSMLIPFEGMLTKIRAEVDVAPVGQDMIIDLLIDGVSIFGDDPDDQLHITDSTTLSNEETVSVCIAQYNTLSVNITQAGASETGGEDLRIIVYFDTTQETDTGGLVFVGASDSPYTVDTADRKIIVDSSEGDIEIILPGVTLVQGLQFYVIKDGVDTNTITVSTDDGNINGSSTLEFDTPWGSVLFLSNGTRYNTL